MREIFILITVVMAVIVSVFGGGQQQTKSERAARELSDFERDWVTASINHDDNWIKRFLNGKLSVAPESPDTAGNRAQQITETIESVIPRDVLTPRNMKVRISGKITVLTNSPAENSSMENRSYSFLDTFNKQNGKWVVIAANFSPASETVGENDEQALTRIESEWRIAALNKNNVVLHRIIANDFVGINSDGRVIDKSQIINSNDIRRISSPTATNIKVRIYGETAIVTGCLSNIARVSQENYNLQGMFTDNWIKRGGQWQLVNSHNTRIQ